MRRSWLLPLAGILSVLIIAWIYYAQQFPPFEPKDCAKPRYLTWYEYIVPVDELHAWVQNGPYRCLRISVDKKYIEQEYDGSWRSRPIWFVTRFGLRSFRPLGHWREYVKVREEAAQETDKALAAGSLELLKAIDAPIDVTITGDYRGAALDELRGGNYLYAQYPEIPPEFPGWTGHRQSESEESDHYLPDQANIAGIRGECIRPTPSASDVYCEFFFRYRGIDMHLTFPRRLAPVYRDIVQAVQKFVDSIIVAEETINSKQPQ